jgi:folate-binding Fe-S cluster repair protein YgfZ
LDAIVRVALCSPPAEGENVTVNEHVWPTGTLVHSVGMKSGALDVMLAMFSVAVPVLEITTGADVELLPAATVPKAKEVGATPMMGSGEIVAIFDQPESSAEVVL